MNKFVNDTFILESAKQCYRAEMCKYQRQSAGGLISYFSIEKFCTNTNCQITLFDRIKSDLFNIIPVSLLLIIFFS